MAATGGDQEADPVIKTFRRGLVGGGGTGSGTLALAGDGGRVSRTATVGLTLAGDLSAAVRIHAVNKAIWEKNTRETEGTGRLDDLEKSGLKTSDAALSADDFLDELQVRAEMLTWHKVNFLKYPWGIVKVLGLVIRQISVSLEIQPVEHSYYNLTLSF